MSEKDKAKELVDKMNVIHYLELNEKKLPVSMHNSQVIQCALIACKEIKEAKILTLNKMHSFIPYGDYSEMIDKIIEYSNNVKKEILKLKE